MKVLMSYQAQQRFRIGMLMLGLVVVGCGKQSFFSGGTSDKKPQVQVDEKKNELDATPSSGKEGQPTKPGGSDGGPSAQETPDPKGEVTLQGISVPYDVINLKVGESATLPVTATYSDKSSKDVTNEASFTPSDAGIASMAADEAGKVVGQKEGSTDVSIAYEDKQIVVRINVVPFAVVKVRITPENASLRVKEQLAYRAIATLDNGEEKDVTDVVTWSVSQATAMTFDRARPGTATAVQAGDWNVQARYNTDIEGSTPVKIFDLPFVVNENISNIKFSSNTEVGINEIKMRVKNLRLNDKVVPTFVTHTVDIKPEYIMGDSIMTDPRGWFEQVITLRFLYKHLPEVTRYEGQRQTFEVTFEDKSTYTIEKIIAVTVVQTDTNGNVISDKPTKTLQGTAGHPGALPASFP